MCNSKDSSLDRKMEESIQAEKTPGLVRAPSNRPLNKASASYHTASSTVVSHLRDPSSEIPIHPALPMLSIMQDKRPRSEDSAKSSSRDRGWFPLTLFVGRTHGFPINDIREGVRVRLSLSSRLPVPSFWLFFLGARLDR